MPTDKSIKVLLNGELLKTDVPAIMSPGAVLLPIRSVGTALGYTVEYDDQEQAGTLTKGNTVYTIKKNMKTVTKTVDGVATQVTLNSATVQTNDRLFIPVRFFAEESGYDIQWDDKLQIVVIRDKQFN